MHHQHPTAHREFGKRKPTKVTKRFVINTSTHTGTGTVSTISNVCVCPQQSTLDTQQARASQPPVTTMTITRYAAHLTLPVDADDAAGCLVRCRHKNRLPTDAVHVYAHTRLNVVQVYVAVFGDQEDDAMLLAGLHKPNTPNADSHHHPSPSD